MCDWREVWLFSPRGPPGKWPRLAAAVPGLAQHAGSMWVVGGSGFSLRAGEGIARRGTVQRGEDSGGGGGAERPAETPPMDIVDSDTAEDAVVGLDSE